MALSHVRLVLVSAFAAAAVTAAADLNVVTTLPDLASLVKEVGGTHVQVSSIVTGARDPHRIEAKPSFMARARSANLWLAVGLELEVAYEGLILEGSGNRNIRVGAPGHAYVSDWVRVRDVPSGTVSRAQGDMHPYGNPHVWLDPYNGRAIAVRLAEKMGTLDKANAGYYKDRADDFVKRVDVAMFGQAAVAKFGGSTLWKWDDDNTLLASMKEKGGDGMLAGWAGKMRPFWKWNIVTYHRSWNYFAYRFGLKVVGELEPKPGLDPTPGHMAGLIQTMKSQRVKAILQEPFYSRRSADFVARETGASVVVAPGSVGHEAAASTYIAMFDAIVNRLAAALGK